ncbi:hypothetical protein [Parabacteroides sp. PF5-9]|uniref:hypothetical protein n=1 Tax=Parabacteroides sp. PF5-9 TaxID=1742404 RepID=UPI002474AD10|nr:hypothetical protein [Parabacteroides sp. PF5-9]MDH6358386.1 hypothetical protein [Parabacteroides sp. PF5-9]
MKNTMNRVTLFSCLFILCLSGCGQKTVKEKVNTTLYDKPLSEIKSHIAGKWQLVHSKNGREFSNYENTFITFKGDDYIWTENKEKESGLLNWRKAPTGNGYDAYVMDAFYAEYPAYPLALKGDTLYIQDITETRYKYTLIRK